MKDQVNFRASALTLRRLSDLQKWWSESQTGAIAEAVHRAWAAEAHFQATGEPSPPWRVEPGGYLFPTEERARQWLEQEQNARQAQAGEWVTLDGEGDPETWWELRQVEYQV